MQLSRAAAYGLQGVLHLARRADNAISGVNTIAQTHNMPSQFLSKIFQALAKAGVLRSHRGAKGGFSLRGPAAEISLKDVIEAIDGPLGVPSMPGDVAHAVWQQVTEQINGVLARTTLADLARAEAQHGTFAPHDPLKPSASDAGQRADGIVRRERQHAQEWMDGLAGSV